MILSLGECVCMSISLLVHIYICVSRRKGEVEQEESRICTDIKVCRFNFGQGRGESYENPSTTKFLSHHSHLKAIVIAVSPPGMFFLKTTTHTSTLHCTQVSGQMPLREIFPDYLFNIALLYCQHFLSFTVFFTALTIT